MPPFPNPAPPDLEGELAYLELGDLFIDPKYQRPIGPRGEKNIRQVIENFSWSLFSPIVVGRRERGKFAIIDGQHRAIAALTHGGITKIPALIINGDASDEAKAFAVINGAVTAIQPTHIWHARVVAGDVDAIRLQRVFDKMNVTILKSPKTEDKMEIGETVAIDAIEGAFRQHGEGILLLALRTIVHTGQGNPGWLRAPIVKGTCRVLQEHPEWYARPDETVRAVQAAGLRNIWNSAQRHRLEAKITVISAYAAMLEKALDRHLNPLAKAS